MGLSCRLCKTSLRAETGCAVCLDWKKNFAADDEDDGEHASLAAVSNEVVGALRTSLKATMAKLRTNALDPDMSSRLLKIGNTMSKVLESARKLQDDGLAAVKAMSFQERAELFLGWYGALPPAHRTSVRSSMAQFEATVAKPITLPVAQLKAPDA